MDRTPSGITNLDKLIEGGFPKGRSILVAGGAGSGKTIFSLQFLYSGAVLYDEPGIYVSLNSQWMKLPEMPNVLDGTSQI